MPVISVWSDAYHRKKNVGALREIFGTCGGSLIPEQTTGAKPEHLAPLKLCLENVGMIKN